MSDPEEALLDATPNPYLQGNFAPVHEELVVDALEVIGEVPEDLDGLYVRNGPDPRYAPRGRYHWFDGDGMLHAARIRGGKVEYRNRWVRTEGFERESASRGPLWTGIIEPLGKNPRLGVHLPLKDTANTDVKFHHGKLLATWYLAGEPYAVDPRTLETLGKDTFGGKLGCNVSAHVKVDAVTDELLFFDYSPRAPFLGTGVVGPDGVLSHYTDVALPGPRMPHDMAITEHHVILMDLPLVGDPEAAKVGRHKLVFRRDWPSRFGVLPRKAPGSAIRWFEAKPCYMYHSVNAWEEGDEIVMDACRVERPQPPEAAVTRLDKMLAYLRLDARLYRYRFNLKTGRTSEAPLDDVNTEFPSMDARLVGRKSRYAYNVHITNDSTLLFDGLVKYDTERGTSETVLFGPGRHGSEAPFAPREGAMAEDDGYLVAFVTDEATRRSELAIFDARQLKSGPVARVLLPQRVPHGFHATWVPGGRLA